VPARSKVWVCGRLPAGIAGSNHKGGMDVCLLLSVVCCQAEFSPLADYSARGVLPPVVRRCALSRNIKNDVALARVANSDCY